MAPSPSAALTLFEPIVYLRGQSAVGQDARGRRRPVDFDAPPSQLRGLLTVTLPKPSRIKSITVTLLGTARTDWPEGIGLNRLELGEETEIHRQTVSLFSARDSSANDVGRRRANSLGPGGAVGLGDDVDWSLAPERAGPSSSQQRSTTSRSPGLVLPTSSLGRRPMSREADEARRSPTLARSIGNAAAKATSALQLSHRSRQATSNPGSPAVQVHAPSAQSSSYFPAFGSLSPDSARTTPATSPIETRGGSVPPTPAANFYTDAPPEYEEVSPSSEMPPPAVSMSARPASNDGIRAAGNGAPGEVGTPQSVLNAGPGSKSILHAAGRQERALMAKEGAAAAAAGSGSGALTPASAKPSTTAHFDRNGGSPQASAPPSVRFNPRDIVVDGMATNTATGSRRTSLDVSRIDVNGEAVSASAPTSAAPSPSTIVGKGKGKAGSGAGSSSVNSPASGRGRKAGIKGLLGGLLREPSESKEHEGRGSRDSERAGSGSVTPSSSQGALDVWPAAASAAAAGSSKHKEEASLEWREFRKGTYTYPISIPLPSNLPPTLHADFGENKYVLQAVVHRAGALTPNLYCESEVTLVHAPDEAGSEETDAIIVERTWDDALSYMVVISGKSFPVGAKVPVWAKFVPLGKVKIHRIIATMEEKTDYYAKGRRIARHEVPRRWTLAKIMSPDPSLPILPLADGEGDAASLSSNPLVGMAEAAAASYPTYDPDVVPSMFSNTGPWEIMTELQVPAKETRINISSSHSKSSIAVHHLIKLTIRVEKMGAKANGKRQLYDIVIEAPISLNHSHTAHAWLSLPDYWSVRDEGAADEDAEAGLRESGTSATSSSGAAGTQLAMGGGGGTGGGANTSPPLAGPSPFRPYMPPPSNSVGAAGKGKMTGGNGLLGPNGPSSSSPTSANGLPHNGSSSSSSSSSGPNGSTPATRGVSPLVLGRRWLALSALASSAPTQGATTVGVGEVGGGGGAVEEGNGNGDASATGVRLPSYSEAARGR